MRRYATVNVGCLVGCQAVAAEDPAVQLQQARSLRCTYTDSSLTEFANRHRTVTETHDKGNVTYDNIDLQHGTADVAAQWKAGAMWFIESAPNGNMIVTTVLPRYAEGSRDCIMIESRHWQIGVYASGEQSSGTCDIMG